MTSEIPTLHTARLTLRPFTLDDAAEVQRLAGAREVAAHTLNIPHPYADGLAEDWIGGHQEMYARGEGINWAIERRADGALLGAIGLMGIHKRHARVELGYWIGTPYWNRGYCTEAAGTVVRYGFEELGLHRIYAQHMTRNPASGRVMQKIGMSHEGCLREHAERWGVHVDLEQYGILRSEYGG